MNKMNISEVTQQYLCTSCGACYAICNNDAISFAETTGGYLFPKVNLDVCVNCGLCYEVCPGINLKKTIRSKKPLNIFVGEVKRSAVGFAVDRVLYDNGQSGGVVTAVLKYLFEKKKIKWAITAYMKEGGPPRGDYLIINNESNLYLTQKSQYTPIPMLKAVKEIEKNSGDFAIVGLACHIQGLLNLADMKSELRKRKIYKLGLVCDRIMTCKAIDYLCKKSSTNEIISITFRDKRYNKYPGNTILKNNIGNYDILDAGIRMDIKDFFTPVRCRLCFDKMNIYADIVFGDPHGIIGLRRDNGETAIIARTKIGLEILEESEKSYIDLIEVSSKEIIDGQNIEKRKTEWNYFMSAWKGLNKTMPMTLIDFQKRDIPNKFKRKILTSIKNDRKQSEKKLFLNLNKTLYLKRILRKFKNLFSIIVEENNDRRN